MLLLDLDLILKVNDDIYVDRYIVKKTKLSSQPSFVFLTYFFIKQKLILFTMFHQVLTSFNLICFRKKLFRLSITEN